MNILVLVWFIFYVIGSHVAWTLIAEAYLSVFIASGTILLCMQMTIQRNSFLVTARHIFSCKRS